LILADGCGVSCLGRSGDCAGAVQIRAVRQTAGRGWRDLAKRSGGKQGENRTPLMMVSALGQASQRKCGAGARPRHPCGTRPRRRQERDSRAAPERTTHCAPVLTERRAGRAGLGRPRLCASSCREARRSSRPPHCTSARPRRTRGRPGGGTFGPRAPAPPRALSAARFGAVRRRFVTEPPAGTLRVEAEDGVVEGGLFPPRADGAEGADCAEGAEGEDAAAAAGGGGGDGGAAGGGAEWEEAGGSDVEGADGLLAGAGAGQGGGPMRGRSMRMQVQALRTPPGPHAAHLRRICPGPRPSSQPTAPASICWGGGALRRSRRARRGAGGARARGDRLHSCREPGGGPRAAAPRGGARARRGGGGRRREPVPIRGLVG